MLNYKNILAAAFMMFGFGAAANAQDTAEDQLDYKPFPHMFVGLQGGAQTTFTHQYDNLKLITPTASVSFGAFFTPVVGARLHVNSKFWGNNAGYMGGFKNADNNFKYDYKYVTTDLDLMVNLVNLFAPGNYHPLNVYLIGGIGLNYAWDNADAYSRKDVMPMAYKDDRLSHNARIGAMVDYNLAKHWSVNLEVSANSINDRINSKTHFCKPKSNTDDWQLTAQIGVAYKFGFKKKPAKVEEWATRIDTIWYDDTAFSPRVEDGKATWNVFYQIRESDFEADQQLAAIGAFLKDHRECKVDIKSYADIQTGNPKINMGYSQQRSEKAVKALTDAGVPASSITASYYGDTVQPFAENDKNRVTIITATGLKDVKDKTTVKKFRTKEVRYKVEK